MKLSSGIIIMALLGGLAFHGHAQKVITEIEFEKSKIDKLGGMVFNDSLFITAESLSMGTQTGKVSYWLRKDGSKRKVDLSKMGDKPIFAVSATAEEEYYYYLMEAKKAVTIKALVIEKKTGQSKIGSEEILLAGNIYGSFVENNDLYLLNAVKGSFTLTLNKIHALTVVNNQLYNLSFDLGSSDASITHLRAAGTEFIPSNGIGNVKITKEHDAIWISVDEPKNPNANIDDIKRLYKTSVIKLDRLNPEKSFVKSFFIDTQNFFISRIFNGYLFRVFQDSYFHCEVINILTDENMFSRVLSRKYEFPNSNIYFRQIDYMINRKTTSRPISEIYTGFINVDTVSSGNYILTVGAWGEIKPTTPLVHFGLLGLLASAATQAIVRELSEGEKIFKYGHINISMDGQFNFTNNSNLIIQKIDDYEIENFKEKVEYKGYLASVGSVFAFYKVKKSNKLQVVEFER